MKNVRMHQILDDETLANSPEAYERLLLDSMNGDTTNFTHWQEVEQSWTFIDHIRRAWDQDPEKPHLYPSGSMGPQASYDLLKKDDFNWIEFNWDPTKESE